MAINISDPSAVPGKSSDQNAPKPDYYTNKGKKIADFLLGFVMIIILNLALSYLLFLGSVFTITSAAFPFISLALCALLIYFFFRIGRRFIAIGMIGIILLPILGLGSCLMMGWF